MATPFIGEICPNADKNSYYFVWPMASILAAMILVYPCTSDATGRRKITIFTYLFIP